MNFSFNLLTCVILLFLSYTSLEVYGLRCYLCFYPETNENGFEEACANSEPQDCNTLGDAAITKMTIDEANMEENLTAHARRISIESHYASLFEDYRFNPKVACGKHEGIPINGSKNIVRGCAGLNGTWEAELPLCYEDREINNCLCNGNYCNNAGRLGFGFVGIFLTVGFGYMAIMQILQ